ncbi:hypothetical protein AJ79_04767 [Helicocarpus griseus UAMH5409]|uniref:MARVEL domain-containing protein n=1 Tax=Helicocarpus griseus UAMH5409 TaxID=1447875 RepID=A0A2B7XT14_9EURO|nr:hypothetical protein AJ79_04767 [Helicocarpus griseus UAMH5409]
MLWYLPRKYRPPILFKILLGLELPVTIALLALFGIAAPDLYRDKLWKDGAENGFNSHPNQRIYTIANYRPYTTPRPFGQFITNFNLVISVLSLFFLICKAPMFILNVFYPPLSVFAHAVLLVLYAVSVAYQASPDMTDPEHPQPGAPWYITKNCNVTKHPSNYGYCQQAKSAFGCTVVMLAIFLVHLIYAIYSCLPTPEIREKQRERLERRKTLEDLKSMKSPIYAMHPTTPGGTALPPMTPRTQAFNVLGGTRDLPLRNHFLPPEGTNGNNSPKNFSMPGANGVNGTNGSASSSTEGQTQTQAQQPEPTMYFPPPPKNTSK